MKNLLSTLLLLVAGSLAPLATAQTATSPFSSPEYFASSFNLWSINAQSPNTYIFQGRSLCNSAGQNITFFDFSTSSPVLIADSNTANSEVVTPSAIVNTAGSCGITASPSHTHYSFQLRSGTAGLQEAILTLKDQSSWPVIVDLDRNWFAQANNIPGTNANTIIGAATGDASVILKDITTATPTYYVWTGSAYSSTAAYWQNTAPTLAAGAAAGTSPTVSNAGTATAFNGIVNVTAGSATTTGTLFTETFPSNSGTTGSFQYSGTCTVTSVGANSFTAFTVATSYTSSHRLLTVTATSSPTAATAYVFSYSCK